MSSRTTAYTTPMRPCVSASAITRTGVHRRPRPRSTSSRSSTGFPQHRSRDRFASVEYRHLGRSGLVISEIIYGNWITHGSQVEEEAAVACVNAALDAGGRDNVTVIVLASPPSTPPMFTHKVLPKRSWAAP